MYANPLPAGVTDVVTFAYLAAHAPLHVNASTSIATTRCKKCRIVKEWRFRERASRPEDILLLEDRICFILVMEVYCCLVRNEWLFYIHSQGIGIPFSWHANGCGLFLIESLTLPAYVSLLFICSLPDGTMDVGLNAKAKMDYIHHLLPYLLHWTYRGILFRHAKIEHFLFSDTLFLDFLTCKQFFLTLGTTESTDGTKSMNFLEPRIARRGAGTMDFWEPRRARIARKEGYFGKAELHGGERRRRKRNR